jgi:hypothetical protein
MFQLNLQQAPQKINKTHLYFANSNLEVIYYRVPYFAHKINNPFIPHAATAAADRD